MNKYKAYIDGSGNGAKDIFVLAGYISTEENWKSFSRDWEAMLKTFKKPKEAFKMYEMTNTQSKLKKCSLFYKIIKKHAFAEISCVIDVPTLKRIVDSISWPKNFYNTHKLKNPYYFSFKAIIDALAQKQRELGIDTPVDFIFDEQTEKVNTLDAWHLILESSNEEFRKMMGEKPIYCDDKEFMPLQAADMLAWCIRDWELNNVDWMEESFLPWDSKSKIPGLNIKFTEEQLRYELSKGITDPEALIKAMK